jgi:NADH:ubiquinone oxidoreductase subunit 4 (subunit M)
MHAKVHTPPLGKVGDFTNQKIPHGNILLGSVPSRSFRNFLPMNPRLFHFFMLAMYSGQIGLFASQDILLFFFMSELELSHIPSLDLI